MDQKLDQPGYDQRLVDDSMGRYFLFFDKPLFCDRAGPAARVVPLCPGPLPQHVFLRFRAEFSSFVRALNRDASGYAIVARKKLGLRQTPTGNDGNCVSALINPPRAPLLVVSSSSA